jgi:hypothetical protein
MLPMDREWHSYSGRRVASSPFLGSQGLWGQLAPYNEISSLLTSAIRLNQSHLSRSCGRSSAKQVSNFGLIAGGIIVRGRPPVSWQAAQYLDVFGVRFMHSESFVKIVRSVLYRSVKGRALPNAGRRNRASNANPFVPAAVIRSVIGWDWWRDGSESRQAALREPCHHINLLW